MTVLAKQGLPIIFCGGVPRRGTFFGETPNEAEIEELLHGKRVVVCHDIDQIPDILAHLQLRPRVAYRGATKVLNVYRKAEDADYVYFYHYADADTHPDMMGAERASFVADLHTDGVPYILDPWTGTISEADIVVRDKNCVSVKLDLAPNDSLIVISVSPTDGSSCIHAEPRRIVAYENAFELQNWTLTVESWTAGDTPLETQKEMVKTAALREPIFFTELEGLESVSGVGCYCTDFDLEKGWEEGCGAYLQIREIEDCYTVEVNGIQIPANQIDPCIDVGCYLKQGKNTLRISVYSTLLNAAIAYCEEHGISHSGRCKAYGMNGPVKVIPYTR